MRVFFAEPWLLWRPGPKLEVDGAEKQVDRDTLVSRTLTVAPGSLAYERALSRERRAGGPPEAAGPSNGTHQPCDQRPM
jgi:hypothetical protein